jgi:hypothetical protein
MSLLQVNWLAVMAGAIISIVLGFLWYGPFFGKIWLGIMETKMGKKRDQMRGSGGVYVLTLIAALVGAYVLDLIIRRFGITEWYKGLGYGALVWIGVGAASSLSNAIFENKPYSLWLLYGLYQLVIYAGLGALFTVWR